MLIRKCLLAMLILMLVILMLIQMLLNLNTGYDDTDADLCIRILSLCCTDKCRLEAWLVKIYRILNSTAGQSDKNFVETSFGIKISFWKTLNLWRYESFNISIFISELNNVTGYIISYSLMRLNDMYLTAWYGYTICILKKRNRRAHFN